jgi:hypothetical protein
MPDIPLKKFLVAIKKPSLPLLLRQLGHLLFNDKTRCFPHPPRGGAGFVGKLLNSYENRVCLIVASLPKSA